MKQKANRLFYRVVQEVELFCYSKRSKLFTDYVPVLVLGIAVLSILIFIEASLLRLVKEGISGSLQARIAALLSWKD